MKKIVYVPKETSRMINDVLNRCKGGSHYQKDNRRTLKLKYKRENGI